MKLLQKSNETRASDHNKRNWNTAHANVEILIYLECTLKTKSLFSYIVKLPYILEAQYLSSHYMVNEDMVQETLIQEQDILIRYPG